MFIFNLSILNRFFNTVLPVVMLVLNVDEISEGVLHGYSFSHDFRYFRFR
jgi:hypothetical protein